MRKHIVQWSALLLSLSLLRIIAPPVMFSFGGMDFSFAVFGSLVGLGALIFTSHAWTHIDFRPLFGLGALLSFSAFLLCLYSPTFGSLRQTYVSLLDMFILLESAIILGFASLQQKEEALSVFTAIPLALQLIARRIRSAEPSRPRLRNAH